MAKFYVESPESEASYKKLAQLGKELGVPTLEAFLEMEIQMPDGKVLHRHKQRSHSWVRNAYNVIFSYLALKNISDGGFGAGNVSLKHSAGGVVSQAYLAYVNSGNVDTIGGVGYLANSGVDTYGILVGSGSNPESFEDYHLQTKITNGVGSGQLSHVAANYHAIAYDAVTKTFSAALVRFFNNNSGGAVTIAEVGLFGSGTLYGGPNAIMTSRDVLTPSLSLPDTGQLKVTYTVQLVYPA